MKKLLKQFVLIGLCILAVLSLAACKDIDRDSTIQKKGDFVPQFYTIGDVEGITAERKCEMSLGYFENGDSQSVTDNIILKNNSDAEKTFVITYPCVTSTRYNDPHTMTAGISEIFRLYGGIGGIKQLDEFEGTYGTKLANKEYFQGLDYPIEDLSLDEIVTVYELTVPYTIGKNVELSISFKYDEAKTRPFLDMLLWDDWDLKVKENGENSLFEAMGYIYPYSPGVTLPFFDAVVIMGEDIGADAFELSAADKDTGERVETEITRNVMTVEEMLIKSLTESYGYRDRYWDRFNEKTRQSLNDTLFRTFDYYNNNGMPVVMLTIDGKERPFVRFAQAPSGQAFRTYGMMNDNPERKIIEKLSEEYNPRLEYTKFYDISLMINEMCFGNEFCATEITLSPGEEKTVSMKYQKHLDYDRDNRSARLNILPASLDDVDMTSFSMTLDPTDVFYINRQNLGLGESDGVYTGSLDPYKEDYTIVVSQRR